MNETDVAREAVEILKAARAVLERHRVVGRYSTDPELAAGVREMLYGEEAGADA